MIGVCREVAMGCIGSCVRYFPIGRETIYVIKSEESADIAGQYFIGSVMENHIAIRIFTILEEAAPGCGLHKEDLAPTFTRFGNKDRTATTHEQLSPRCPHDSSVWKSRRQYSQQEPHCRYCWDYPPPLLQHLHLSH